MALQHKSKLQVHRELKPEIGFEEYLEYVNGAPSRLFLSFVRTPMGCLRSCEGMVRRVGHRSVLIVRLVRNQLSMFSLNVHHMIAKD